MNTEEAKRIFQWVWIALVVLVVFLGVKTIDAFKDLGGADPNRNTITVTGEGKAISLPDVATFSFTVSADAKTVSEAQEAVTKKIEAIIKGLAGIGIEEKDIKTTNYSVYPKYSYASMPCSPNYCPPSRQTQDGYTASHNITVKVRNTNDAGKALGVAGDLGATDLSGINFTADDPDKAYEEARAEAIQDAREKAKVLTKDLGVRLGKVVDFQENTGGYPMPYMMGAMEGGVSRDLAVKSSPTIPIGENEVVVNVVVIYEIR